MSTVSMSARRRLSYWSQPVLVTTGRQILAASSPAVVIVVIALVVVITGGATTSAFVSPTLSSSVRRRIAFQTRIRSKTRIPTMAIRSTLESLSSTSVFDEEPPPSVDLVGHGVGTDHSELPPDPEGQMMIDNITSERENNHSIEFSSNSTPSLDDGVVIYAEKTDELHETSLVNDVTNAQAKENATLAVSRKDRYSRTIFNREGNTNVELMPLLVGDDKEGFAKHVAHNELDLGAAYVAGPVVPISYDDRGMVQADAYTITAPSLEADYPPLVEFLFQTDENGRTLATKVFNAALLAASFGYVFYTVFNIDRGMTRGWSPAEITMRIPLDTWASYENSLSEKPVATKTIINIVIYLLGDWLSQTIFQKKDVLDFDAIRTLRNGFVGMCFGPAVHLYYEFSDWILPVEGLTLGITNRAFKILMDQTIYLSVKCSIYIIAIAVLNGESVESGTDNVKNRLKPIMFTAWKFWPLVHCVTYGLIPARHRILWVNSVDLLWNAILASKVRE